MFKLKLGVSETSLNVFSHQRKMFIWNYPNLGKSPLSLIRHHRPLLIHFPKLGTFPNVFSGERKLITSGQKLTS